jgi:hypothetical protein
MTQLRRSDVLPSDLADGLRQASFYSKNGTVLNIRSGIRDAYECAVFDFESTGETTHTTTVVALKAISPTTPTTWLSRGSGLQLERVGDWILGFEKDRSVSSDKCAGLVSDVLNLLEYAKEFPQNA